ncbi:MAG TPA: sigma-E processing peptidase SpoIIGA [Firmicutes bacterium]|nr:sigma-E processing peptidase SpoIIGA [Bacillota bacterium]
MNEVVLRILQSCFMAFVMHYLILWATSGVLGLKSTSMRLSLGAFFAGLIDSVIIFLMIAGIIATPSAILLAFISIIPAARVSYGRLLPRKLLVTVAYVYVITIMGGGGGLAVSYLTGGKAVPAFIATIATVLVVAELGWGLVHRKIREWLFFVPIEILFGEERVFVNALIDTGNRLRDPITGAPVIILEYSAVASILPGEVRRVFGLLDAGDLAAITDIMANSPWSSRFRVIPFASIGKEKGMLIGFRPDEVRIVEGDRRASTRNAVVGIYTQRLSAEGGFRALLHPEILESAS